MKKLESAQEWTEFLAQKGQKVAVVTTDWCGVCKRLIKSIDKADLEMYFVQVVSSTIPSFRTEHKITTYPTVCLFEGETLTNMVTTSKLEIVRELINPRFNK